MNFYAKHFDELTTRELYEILRSRAEIFVVEQKISYVDMDEIDYNCLHCYIEDGGRVEFLEKKDTKMLTKVDFFEHGLTGADGSADRRDLLSDLAGLPRGMTPNALLEALNLLYSYDEAISLIEKI